MYKQLTEIIDRSLGPQTGFFVMDPVGVRFSGADPFRTRHYNEYENVPSVDVDTNISLAWWLMPRTPDPEVGGSSPTRVKPCCVLEQGTFTPQKYW